MACRALQASPRPPEPAEPAANSAPGEWHTATQKRVLECLTGRAAAFLHRDWCGDSWAALQASPVQLPSFLNTATTSHKLS